MPRSKVRTALRMSVAHSDDGGSSPSSHRGQFSAIRGFVGVQPEAAAAHRRAGDGPAAVALLPSVRAVGARPARRLER